MGLLCWLCICCGLIYQVIPQQWVCMSHCTVLRLLIPNSLQMYCCLSFYEGRAFSVCIWSHHPCHGSACLLCFFSNLSCCYLLKVPAHPGVSPSLEVFLFATGGAKISYSGWCFHISGSSCTKGVSRPFFHFGGADSSTIFHNLTGDPAICVTISSTVVFPKIGSLHLPTAKCRSPRHFFSAPKDFTVASKGSFHAPPQTLFLQDYPPFSLDSPCLSSVSSEYDHHLLMMDFHNGLHFFLVGFDFCLYFFSVGVLLGG
jgi:hypothetical protein